jgi:hypothetical protein
MGKQLCAALCLLGISLVTFSQEEDRDRNAVTYEEIYDEPYSINKLFIQFQPLYGEVFATNMNAGFGLEAHYFLKNKANFKAQFRKPYTKGFYDFTRDLASKVSDVDNRTKVFAYYEIGGTYHIKDEEKGSKTKMFLYKNLYKKNTWAAMVPLNIEVPCKVRTIHGVRLGGIFWSSSVDVNRALSKQDLSYTDLKNTEGNSLPDNNLDLFSNISSKGLYVGGSITWIRNVAISIDRFETGVDDLILTTYFDILYSPSLELDDIVYTPKDANGVGIVDERRTYDISPITTKSFGFRAGIEGKFNRALSWSYGGEIGYRPGIEGRTFFALLKISFPVFSTNLNYKVEAFGK